LLQGRAEHTAGTAGAAADRDVGRGALTKTVGDGVGLGLDADRGRAGHVALLHGVRERAGPAGAPPFPVAVDVDADLLLHLQDLEDVLVLYLAQLLFGDAALGVGDVGVLDRLRSEEAADLLRAVLLGHVLCLLVCSRAVSAWGWRSCTGRTDSVNRRA